MYPQVELDKPWYYLW